MRTDLELVGEDEVPLIPVDHQHQQNPDFVTKVFNHKEVLALTPRGKLSTRDKLIAMIAGQVKEDEIYRREGQSMPNRAVRMAFLARLFGGGDTRVVAVPSSPSKDDKPKSFFDRLNASSLLPILASIMLAAAAYKTGETMSWKSTSDAGKQTVDFVKEQLAIANQEKAALQAKNDGLQRDALALIAQINTDNNANAKVYADSLKTLVTKYAPPKVVINIPAQTPKTDGN